ncbi:hypothetical protein ACFQNF_06200 [Iodobacter arcticus]|uniref:Uncharacterized protein n=1 Tax=Iodobacter arcticus TaxID=590593 RepID=A0ABW2R040_9NEIS
MRYLIISGIVGSLIAALGWLAWHADQEDSPPPPPIAAKPAPNQAAPGKHWLNRFYPSDENAPLLATAADLPAAESMAEARINGEPRTPPILRSESRSEAATPLELADHSAYQQYETRQNLRELAAFSKAVPAQLQQLQDDIRRGKAAGIAPELIAKQERKVAELAALRQQLLASHPEINPEK